eukprot:gene2698-12907_t
MQIAGTYMDTYATARPTPAPPPAQPTPPPAPLPTACASGASCHDCFFDTFHCQDAKHPINSSACFACVDAHR